MDRMDINGPVAQVKYFSCFEQMGLKITRVRHADYAQERTGYRPDANRRTARQRSARLHCALVRAGVTTAELDRLCHVYMREQQQTIPAPLNYQPSGYPPY